MSPARCPRALQLRNRFMGNGRIDVPRFKPQRRLREGTPRAKKNGGEGSPENCWHAVLIAPLLSAFEKISAEFALSLRKVPFVLPMGGIPFAGLFVLAAAVVFPQAYTITTAAGSDPVGDNGAATSAILFQAEGVAADVNGNVYVADAAGQRVRKITREGLITTIAGTGVAGFSGDGGPAAEAQLNSPYGLALDGLGDLYIADLGNARVRRVGIDGIITTVAGGGSLPAGGANEGSAATLLALAAPRNIAWDGHDGFYISDFSAHRVYRLSEDGTLTTAAGTGVAGFSGDGGPAASARLDYPAGLAVDRQGALYIADSQNHAIRKVANGLMSTIAHASTPTGLAIDGTGTLYIADPNAGEILALASSGAAVAFPIPASDLALDFQGDLYATEPDLVLRVSLYGNSAIVGGGGSTAFGDGGPATAARLNHPSGVAMDAAGNLYIADRDNNRIRRVSVDGTISTIAGTGEEGDTGDGGPAIDAKLNAPSAVSVDSSGNVYICDTGNGRVRLITSGGIILPVSVPGLKSPAYVMPDASGNLYIADDGSGTIVKRSASGEVTTILDNLASPRGLALDADGNLYFTEAGGPHVRRLDPQGNLTSIADGVWNVPRGIVTDDSGGVFVADTGLQQILHVDSSGKVTTVAGTGSPGFSGDGGNALSAALNFPWDIAAGSEGALYVADLENNRIRELLPGADAVTTIQVLNGASLQPGPVAPGMLVDLPGTGLTASDAPQVLFDSIDTPVLALDSTRLIVEAPPEIAGHDTVQIQVVNQGQTVAQASAQVVDAAPALLADSNGQASAVNQDGTLNSPSNPAPRGSIVSLYGTGQGVAGLPVRSPSAAIRARCSIRVPWPATRDCFRSMCRRPPVMPHRASCP